MMDRKAQQPKKDVEVVNPWDFYGTDYNTFLLQNCKQTKHREAQTTQVFIPTY
jgi:hypothetical protein